MPRLKPRLLLVLIPIIAIIMLYFNFNNSESGGETVAVTVGEAVKAVYATGVVEPVYYADLSPQQTARLTEILKDEGQEVAEGEAVAVLENSVSRARLEEAEAALAFLERDYARQRVLVTSGATSRRTLEDTESNMREARARVEAVKKEIGNLRLISPLSGTVLRRDVEPGETVQAGETAITVGKPSPLRITAEIDEEDIAGVALGQTALIKADAYPGEVMEGTISEITPKGDPVAKIFRARIKLPGETPLMVGMTTEINIITGLVPNALLIPLESERGGKVWNAHGEPVEVKTGIRGESMIQVTGGLKEGDVILKQPPEEEK